MPPILDCHTSRPAAPHGAALYWDLLGGSYDQCAVITGSEPTVFTPDNSRLSRARVTGYRGSGTPYGLASHPSASMPAASAARTSALVGLTALLPWSVFSRPRARPDSTNGNAENVGVPTHAPESQPPNPMPEPRTRRGKMPLKPRRTRYHGLESLVIAGQERRARWRS